MLNLLMNVNKLYYIKKNALIYASHEFALHIKTEQTLRTLK